MKAADALKARLGDHMRESIGAAPAAGDASEPPRTDAGFQNGTSRYQGAARIRDALAIEVDRIMPDPDQPRKQFDPDELAELAASLKGRGQLQPCRVRWDLASGRWVLISGERRWRAATMAGLTTLVCIEAKGPLTPDEVLMDQLTENALRANLKPLEAAAAYKALLNRCGWTYRRLAEHLHISPATIGRTLALLELPESVRAGVEQGTLAATKAYDTHSRRRKAKGGGLRPRLFRSPGVRIRVEPSRKATRADVVAALRAVLSQLETELSQEGERAA